MLAKYIHLDDQIKIETLRALGFQYLVESSHFGGSRSRQSDSDFIVAIPTKELSDSKTPALELSSESLHRDRHTYLVNPKYFG
jgi:hypothetical protein